MPTHPYSTKEEIEIDAMSDDELQKERITLGQLVVDSMADEKQMLRYRFVLMEIGNRVILRNRKLENESIE